MTPYAIIQLAGKQYKVSEGDTLVVNRLDQAAEGEFTLTDVLLTASDKATNIGAPLVPKASVVLKVVDHHQGDKIMIFKYKSKSRYRRTNGHRQPETTLQVVKITA